MNLRILWKNVAANGVSTLLYSRDDGRHYLVSTVASPEEESGTFVFRSDPRGDVADRTDVLGGDFWSLEHEQAIDLMRELDASDFAVNGGR